MSGLRPLFLTGANAKIKLNGKTLAFCTDLSYSIQVLHQTPKVLGMYEGSSVEPLGYTVSGSFTIIRYVRGVKDATKSSVQGAASNDAGNGIGNWGPAWSKSAPLRGNFGSGNEGRPNENLNPSRLDEGTTFDIQVYQKVSSGDGVIKDIGVANIRNCRITQSDFNLTKKGAAVQRFTFTALYADEDSFVADFSGQGQHF